MKKYLAILLAAIMMLSCFAGCNNETPEEPVTPEQPGTTTPEQPGTTTPEQPAQPTTGPDGRVIREDQTYYGIYSSEMSTLNYLSTGQTYNLTVGANCIDPLVENDQYGNIVPCGAESWTTEYEEYTNADGETVVGQKWTFKLRAGQKWYDNNGNEMADVTAHDYVAGIRYVSDANMDCDNSYLVEGWVRGAAERWAYTYALSGAVAKGEEAVTLDEDGDKVYTEYVTDENGVLYEVVWDKDTDTVKEFVEYPEVKPEDVMIEATDDLTVVYHLEKPRPYFLTAMGFGCYWPAPADMLDTWGTSFGTDNTTMWFNGAYILETLAAQQERIYVKNENNWDAENIHITKIHQTYNADSSAVAPQLFLQGEIDGCDVDADLLDAWQADPETAGMVSPTRVSSDYSYFYTFNFEPMYDEEFGPENWVKAVNVEDFRQAVAAGLNRELLLQVGYPNNYKDLVQNAISPKGSYINDGKDYVTYGDLAPIAERDSYNTDKAVEYMKKAIPQIQAAGGTFPVVFYVQYNGSADWGSECTLLKQSMETLFNTDELKALAGGNDVVSFYINNFGSQSFLTGARRSGKYSIQRCNWGADYADPETWTDPFADDNSYNFAYDTTNKSGILQNRKTPETMAIIEEYFRLVEEAKKEYDDMDKRFEAFAKAEAYYINHAMVVPYAILGGSYQATKLNGFEGQYAGYGQASSRYKGQWVYETAMSEEMFYAQMEVWQNGGAQ